ncbi:hypothetical protein K474DRAFT_1763758 [Panus rudis PR-1116 ss-1]|nr:hypothetical protein K474DRAFT_1763758 [Panus rudis PR-1116 ss-1]
MMFDQPPPTTQPAKRYNIRADVHFDAAANLMTVIFELPGVKKTDLRICMSVCPYSRVRQLTITGRNRPFTPRNRDGFSVQERKYGEFTRTVIVPPETKPDDIDAFMEDGILTLQVPGGTPVAPEGLQDIVIR